MAVHANSKGPGAPCWRGTRRAYCRRTSLCFWLRAPPNRSFDPTSRGTSRARVGCAIACLDADKTDRIVFVLGQRPGLLRSPGTRLSDHVSSNNLSRNGNIPTFCRALSPNSALETATWGLDPCTGFGWRHSADRAGLQPISVLPCKFFRKFPPIRSSWRCRSVLRAWKCDEISRTPHQIPCHGGDRENRAQVLKYRLT